MCMEDCGCRTPGAKVGVPEGSWAKTYEEGSGTEKNGLGWGEWPVLVHDAVPTYHHAHKMHWIYTVGAYSVQVLVTVSETPPHTIHNMGFTIPFYFLGIPTSGEG